MSDTVQFLLTTGIPTIAVVFVGFVLNRQIKSQNEILENYKNYISTTDWKKVKDHYEDFIIPAKIEKLEKEVSKELNELSPLVNELTEQRREVTGLVLYLLMSYFEKEEAQKIITEKLPKTALRFEALWSWYDEQQAGTQEES